MAITARQPRSHSTVTVSPAGSGVSIRFGQEAFELNASNAYELVDLIVDRLEARPTKRNETR